MKKSICLVVAILVAPSANSSAQVFDERLTDWPVDYRINGSVMIDGGRPSAEISEWFWRTAGSQQAALVSLVLGEGDLAWQHPRGAETQSHAVFQCKRDGTLFVPGDGDSGQDENALNKALSTASGVWVRGDGRPAPAQRSLLTRINEHLHQVIERRGVVYAGRSVAESTGQFEMTGGHPLATIQSGLNLVPDCVIQLDFDLAQHRPRLFSVLAAHPKSVGIGVDSSAAVILRGRTLRVMGAGQATTMLMANERQPLRIKTIRQAPSDRSSPYEYLVDLTSWRRDAIDRTLEPFPPAQPKTPLVENGTLIIVGGGKLPDGLMDRFVQMAGGENARLIYVPCTQRDKISSRNLQLLQAWKSEYGVAAADALHTKDRRRANTDQEFLKPLSQATGIWFGGGRQWNFSDSYYGTRAHQLMKQVLQRGGVIAGSSAGASIQARYLARANPLGNIDIMAAGYERGGLGFISGVAIDQHFSQRGRQPDMTQLVNRYPQLLGIGIDEGTALIVGQSVGEITGEGQVFFYDRGQHAAGDEPDYLALPAGAQFDLAQRVPIENPASNAASASKSESKSESDRRP